jgi:cyclase
LDRGIVRKYEFSVAHQKTSFTNMYEIWTNRGTINPGRNQVELAKVMEILGAREIVVNSIDNDGVMKGYDLDLIQRVRDIISLPMTVIGGAGTLNDIGYPTVCRHWCSCRKFICL